MRLFLAILALSLLVGCTIPVVGNSPEEVKHRKSIQMDDSKSSNGINPDPTANLVQVGNPNPIDANPTNLVDFRLKTDAEASESLTELAVKIQKRDGTNFIGQYLGMIAEHSYGKWTDYDKGHSVMLFSASSGELLRWISYDEFRQVYVLKTRPEYLPPK